MFKESCYDRPASVAHVFSCIKLLSCVCSLDHLPLLGFVVVIALVIVSQHLNEKPRAV